MSSLTRSPLDGETRPGRGRNGHIRGRQGEERLDGVEVFQQVLTMRAQVDQAEMAAFIRRTLQEIHAHINDLELEVAGPPFSLCHPLPGHIVDVEAGWPVSSALGTEQIHAGAIPAGHLKRHSIAAGRATTGAWCL